MDIIAILNPPREDGFPKITNISKGRDLYEIDPNDPIFSEPLSKKVTVYIGSKSRTIYFNPNPKKHGQSA